MKNFETVILNDYKTEFSRALALTVVRTTLRQAACFCRQMGLRGAATTVLLADCEKIAAQYFDDNFVSELSKQFLDEGRRWLIIVPPELQSAFQSYYPEAVRGIYRRAGYAGQILAAALIDSLTKNNFDLETCANHLHHLAGDLPIEEFVAQNEFLWTDWDAPLLSDVRRQLVFPEIHATQKYQATLN